uniref:Myelin basic protein n=1 Tax=Cyprinus carpio carpio TaxID=630221 RepID=A0A9J7ZMI4_CYPCA
MPCKGGDDTFKGQPFFLRSAEDYREGLQSVPRTDFGLSGDKKRKGKGSFRGHLSSSPQRPQHSSTRRRGDVNPVVHFFRSFVSSPRPKSRWRELLGLSDSLLLDDFETARLFLSRSRHPRQHVARRALDRLTDAEGSRKHSPESSTWEKADLALHKNAKMEESETDEKQKLEREDLCPILEVSLQNSVQKFLRGSSSLRKAD